MVQVRGSRADQPFPNGSSALLVLLSGTIPVVFRGTTYRFPISVWVPHAYPSEPPIVYVTPTETMVVRPGQHVDSQGCVYHPYLTAWSTYWDKSNIVDFLNILREVFAKEPPVVARQRPPPPQQTPTPPPVPPLPPEFAPRPPSSQPAASASSPAEVRPPPPPPKPGQERPVVSPPPQTPSPQVPPPPPKVGGPAGHLTLGQPSHLLGQPQLVGQTLHLTQEHPAQPFAGQPQGQPAFVQPQTQAGSIPPLPPKPGPSRYEAPPPLPPQASTSQQTTPHQPPLLPHQSLQPTTLPPGPPPSVQRPTSIYEPPPQPYSAPPATQPYQQPPAQPQPPQQLAKSPPPNLLDDDATPPLPTTESPSQPPPPPPNPEKDALLHQLAITLYNHRQKSYQQNTTSLAGLRAQRKALLQAYATLQSELTHLTQLSSLLQSNTSILQSSLQKADETITKAQHQLKENGPPDVDELLVAPTVVGNQLYELVAEERAIGDVIFVLGRAVERGRIAPGVFVKAVRGLAREWYLKKALVRKIGRGMGLAGA
ncbi:uncharacterized protein CTHT_0045720 [Thermochaetoides thermophila DSM 1495]|uniref:Uncharacterized protein n=1 Tax=Chaetomium thermophilum (strain DSM 1495 / CBS 144.50 / IMI 039719) TaxID=759272 RepID=G0S9F7_CHATD|nr:hypothetical protein CTHT_0045720 [Thermochaetoides thermophila DSM 1495]EGS20068.1 hypothetical protein CTHT_0045720 [Thermochaetoides thermophila DSM 1495]